MGTRRVESGRGLKGGTMTNSKDLPDLLERLRLKLDGELLCLDSGLVSHPDCEVTDG
jgi:hypothetical protein